MTKTGLLLEDGTEETFDVIILSTGFITVSFRSTARCTRPADEMGGDRDAAYSTCAARTA